LLANASITPVGSPTYLTFARVDATQVPAAGDPTFDYASFADARSTVWAAPAWNGSDSSRVAIETAGEVLRAGKATEGVVADPNWDDGRVDALDSRLSAEIDGIVSRTAAATAPSFAGVTEAGLESRIHAELDALGPVERQAILLGRGGAVVDRIARNVSRTYSLPADPRRDYGQSDFRRHLAATIRWGLDHEVATWGPSAATVEHTRDLGRDVRREVNASLPRVADRRLETAAADTLANTSRTGPGDRWLASDPGDGTYGPASVSSGTSLVERPKWGLLTTNVWNVTVHGEYARFVLRSSGGSAATDGMTAYVRQEGQVSMSIPGEGETTVGHTEAVSFTANVSLLVAVPADSLGVGDRTGTAVECSDSTPKTGAISSSTGVEACAGTETSPLSVGARGASPAATPDEASRAVRVAD
jgi:hypothetical protein